jgi:uncharacterized protein
MFVGVLRLTLFLPEPGSLKSKRHLVRSAIDRVKAKFNVSIAEVAENDLWQKSVLGVAAVGNDHAFVNESLDKVADFVASMHGGQIQVTGRDLEIVSYGDGMGEAETRTLAEAEADAAARYERSWEEDLRAKGEPDEAPPAPQGAPDSERGSAASTDLARAGGPGGRREARRSEWPPDEKPAGRPVEARRDDEEDT